MEEGGELDLLFAHSVGRLFLRRRVEEEGDVVTQYPDEDLRRDQCLLVRWLGERTMIRVIGMRTQS